MEFPTTDDHERSIASFTLPPSPICSPTGSDSISIWVEDTLSGEHHVHLSSSQDPSLSASATSVPSQVPVFPLVLWKKDSYIENDHHSDFYHHSSSALVPFQQLQVNTNLNATTMPFPRLKKDFPRTRAKSISSLSSSSEKSTNKKTTTSKLAQFTGEFCSHETLNSPMTHLSQDFVTALQLDELTQGRAEPQLSVRLRGNRVELTSVSSEDHVDFLGPAENIKRLFKLPYSQSKVSLAVHRVGATLVVDGELNETDLPAGFEDLPQDTLQLAQQPSDDMSQRWLYEKFIYESTVNTTAVSNGSKKQAMGRVEEKKAKRGNTSKKKYCKKAKQKTQKLKTLNAAALRNETQTETVREQIERVSTVHNDNERGMSIPVPSPLIPSHGSSWTTDTAESHSGDDIQQEVGSSSSSQSRSYLPSIPTETNWSTSAAQHSPAYGDSQTFERILKWKFNDLKMILGSQVLLFSNQEHPAVSLKLHDMDKELSLCTVLDYYLDNVIANIPELAICMHSKGLVRGYKLVETRQIPYMSGSGRPLFDVQDVSMNASMLLKFLQENCSRPNGTYWLHRKEGETSLRLYDIDVLSRGSQLKWKYMMAMLCYRFAARASRLSNSLAAGSPHLQQQLQQRQRELLRTCMSLLGEIAQKGGPAHSSICSSVSEQLADTYLRECNQCRCSNVAKSAPEDSDRDATVRLLEKAKQYLLASIILFEECIRKGSSAALTHSDDGTDETAVIEGERELASEDGDEDSEMNSFMDEELKRLQLKCSSTCVELGRLHASNLKWMDAVKDIVEASQFLTPNVIPDDMHPLDLTSQEQEVALDSRLDKLDFDGVGRGGFCQDKITICVSEMELRCSLLDFIGDMAARRPVSVYGRLTALFDIISGAKRDELARLRENASEWLMTFEDDEVSLDNKTHANREEGLLMLSFLAYLHALSPPVDSELFFILMRKLGNASNELGKYYLAVKCDYKEAFRWFERGCKIFNNIEDGVNVALLWANLAHLHKIFAQGKSMNSREEHYQAAIQLCTEALQLLKQSKADADLNRKVKGELALTFLVWAVDLASSVSSLDAAGRCPPKARENTVLKNFNKALTLYTELIDKKQTASTHYQIASFYSRMISNTLLTESKSTDVHQSDGPSALTSRMEIARRHYEKALSYFGAVEVGKTFVLIHQELADLHILGGQLEGIEHALLILLSTLDAFSAASSMDSKVEKDDMSALARDIVIKVKAVLHQLIRLCSVGRLGSTNTAHARSKKLEMFKTMYKEMIYNDEYDADSVVSILSTLRRMYLL